MLSSHSLFKVLDPANLKRKKDLEVWLENNLHSNLRGLRGKKFQTELLEEKGNTGFTYSMGDHCDDNISTLMQNNGDPRQKYLFYKNISIPRLNWGLPLTTYDVTEGQYYYRKIKVSKTGLVACIQQNRDTLHQGPDVLQIFFKGKQTGITDNFDIAYDTLTIINDRIFAVSWGRKFLYEWSLNAELVRKESIYNLAMADARSSNQLFVECNNNLLVVTCARLNGNAPVPICIFDLVTNKTSLHFFPIEAPYLISATTLYKDTLCLAASDRNNTNNNSKIYLYDLETKSIHAVFKNDQFTNRIQQLTMHEDKIVISMHTEAKSIGIFLLKLNDSSVELLIDFPIRKRAPFNSSLSLQISKSVLALAYPQHHLNEQHEWILTTIDLDVTRILESKNFPRNNDENYFKLENNRLIQMFDRTLLTFDFSALPNQAKDIGLDPQQEAEEMKRDEIVIEEAKDIPITEDKTVSLALSALSLK